MKMQIVLSVATLAVVAPSFGETTVTTNETGIVYDIASWQKSDGFETKTARLAWPGKQLADIVAIKGTMAGGWIGGSYSANGVIYDRTETSLKVQFQCTDTEWGNNKVVRAELAETAEGVTIKLTGAGVATKALGEVQPDSIFTTPVATSATGEGYGVKGVEAYGDMYEIDEFPQPTSGGITVNGGTLRVNVSTDVESAADIAGNGRLWFKEGTTPAAREAVYNTAALPADSSWVTVLTDTELKDVTLTGGTFGGSSVDGTKDCMAYNAATQSDGSIIVQLQRLSWDFPRCVRVQIRQNGANIQAKGIDSYYLESKGHLGEDATKWNSINAFSKGKYVIYSLTFSRTGRYGVTLRGTKSWKGGTKVDGVRLNARTKIMPDKSVVKVVNGGILGLSVENAYNHYPHNTYDLAEGTQLLINGFDAVNCTDAVIADAASVKIVSDNRVYLNTMTLKNGATVSGYTFRVGNTEPAVWTTSGTKPIVVSASVETVRSTNEKLTIDAGADVEFGKVYEMEGKTGTPIVKTGAGKLTFGGVVTSTGNLTLGGGTLSLKDTLTAAGLVLTDDSTLEVASGKTATFGNSSALDWTAGKTLNLVGALADKDKTVRVGTTAEGLVKAQLQQICFGSWKAYLDDAGWLHGRQPGLSVFVR